jgi:hypothetical protein
MDAERQRLIDDPEGWRRWGPYLAERAWGSVREDYGAEADPWRFFPHDHARSRAYRWNEDGLAGISNDHQHLCFALAFWNGRDPILKERIFGLTGPEGNHGEDAKEYWWYDDCTPTHSFMRWRYLYSHNEFPYNDLLERNARAGKLDPEYELVDTGVLDNNEFWDISVEYAKASPDDIFVRIKARNAASVGASLHVLPTLWFRNVWSWGIDDVRSQKPGLRADGESAVVADHGVLGEWRLDGDQPREILLCENETNNLRLWNSANESKYPKDGINDYVVHGDATVNPERVGTKAAFHYVLEANAGQTVTVNLRLRSSAVTSKIEAGQLFDVRQAEADAFYAALAPKANAEEKMIMRQALAGMLWSKQLYHYDVQRWLDGDPAGVKPPESRKSGRNSEWRHLDSFDVISMPDKWEYPWFAAWDLAFHCVALSRVDANFAKQQLLLLCREWYMHPDGQLPAYEWNFGDVNPPVHGWSALDVFHIDGSTDYDFLERIFHKLLLNFTWWVNRKDAEGNNLFEGGFLGLDNIGPFDRSKHPDIDGVLEQADGTAWMASFCLSMLEIALVLAEHDRTYEDMATKFFEHFAMIASAIQDQGIWDENDGFYYDKLTMASGESIPLRVRSTVGLIPLLAVTTLTSERLDRLPVFKGHFEKFLEKRPQFADVIGFTHESGANRSHLFSVVSPERLRRVLGVMLDESEFLSPYGLRSVSRVHGDRPFSVNLGNTSASVDYEPAESTSGLFGGNSNWRGPVWFPTNFLLLNSLKRFARFVGSDFEPDLEQAADDIARRLVSIFVDDANGRRPVFANYELFQSDPLLHDRLFFHEYFHGDTGKGLGASHQTGWTGLVAELIIAQHS